MKFPGAHIKLNSIDHTDHIVQLVNEWLPTEKFIKCDATFLTESTYEKDIMAVLNLTVNSFCEEEMKYHGKFGHNIRLIQHINIMTRIETCYTA